MPKPELELTRRKKKFGRCRICQKFGQLTKEHVPPEKAFNNKEYLEHYVEETEKAIRLNWKLREQNTNGIYVFTLCKKCNNQTGHRYGSDYIDFVTTFLSEANPSNANGVIKVDLTGFFPLRVVKQAISMVLSTSKPTSFLDYEFISSPQNSLASLREIVFEYPNKNYLSTIYEQLRNFVRKRDLTGFPAGVRLYAFASANFGIGFRTGIFAVGKLSSKKSDFAVVTGLHPIHWVLVLGGELDEKLLEVTDWADFGYKEKKTLKIEMPCYWLAGKYPLDFRTPYEINAGNFLNSMRFEGFIPTPQITEQEELIEAIFFARVLGKITKDGYLISKFSSGIYFEFGEMNGWLPNGSIEDVLELVKRAELKDNSNL